MFKRSRKITVAVAAVFLVQSVAAVSVAGSDDFSETLSDCAVSVYADETGTAEQTGTEGTESTVTESDPVTVEDVVSADTAEELKELSAAYDSEDYENNEILVMYNDGNVELRTYTSVEALEAGLAELENDESVYMYQPNFSYENESSDSVSMDRLLGSGTTDDSDDSVSVPTDTTEVTPDDVSGTGTLMNDTYYSAQWALYNDGSFKGSGGNTKAVAGIDVNAEEAWAEYSGKRNVLIAIVDTGVDITNPELSGHIWTNPNEIAGNGVDDDNNGFIDDVNGWDFYYNNNVVYYGSEDDHGTHCAGSMVAAANNGTGIAGLADYDNIELMPVKALGGSDGSGSTLSVIMGIRYAERCGAQICNLSMGTQTSDPMLYQVIRNSDMLFVVAAGNSTRGQNNTDIFPSYPASYNLDNIISVANIGADGTMSSSSCYGKYTVDLAAPGTDILGLVSGDKYGYQTGTSMAAPLVTAAAAMVYSNSTNITLADTKDILLATTKDLPSMAGKCVTGGMLDVGAAVSYNTSGISSRDWEVTTGGKQQIERTQYQNTQGGFRLRNDHGQQIEVVFGRFFW